MKLSSLPHAVSRYFFKKELLGWSFAGKYYRLRKPAMVAAFTCIDAIGSLLFSLKTRKPPDNPNSILIIQLDHIGDMVLCSSLIQTINKTYPAARITVLIRELADEIAKGIVGIDEILHLHTPWLSREKPIGWIGVLRFCFKRFRRYDLAFEVHGEPRNIFISFLLARFRVGLGVRGLGFLLNKNVPWIRDYASHIIEVQGMLLCAVAEKTIPPVKPALSLPLSAEITVSTMLASFSRASGAYILFQMSSGERNREWPLANWKTLIERLLQKGHALVCADRDRAKTAELASLAVSGNRIHFINLRLLEYAALVRRARCVISLETFSAHIAACFDTPVLVLHSGVTLQEEWGPYSKRKIVLQDTSCALYPCSLRSCPIASPSPCMRAISVDRVMEQLDYLLKIHEKTTAR